MKKRPVWRLFFVGVLLGLVLFGAGLWARRNIVPGLGAAGEAELVYLSPLNAPELWRISVDGQHGHPLTQSGGRVFDYAIAPNRKELVYSAGNDLGGLDLWSIPSAGGAARLLLDCGADRCAGAAYAPDGLKIAYSRRSRAENPGGSAAGVGRLWILELSNGTTHGLYANAAIAGQDVTWSPDGSHLAFYDPLAGAIHVGTLSRGVDQVLAVTWAGSGAWTVDGTRFVFGDEGSGPDRLVGQLFEFSLGSGQVRPAYPNLELREPGIPAFAPGGKYLAVAGQLEGEGASRSIWVLRMDGTDKLRVAENPQASQGAYRWDFAGERLVYQELLLGSSERRPSIWIWMMASRVAQKVAGDAALPGWVR